METKLTDNSEDFKRRKAEAIERALETIGGLMERYAKQNCPVDTGNLRNSITNALEGVEAVIVGTNVEYAPFVEFDDKKKHVSGQAHFLRDSVANHISEYKTIISNEAKKVSK